MRAVEITQPGGPEVLRAAERPKPVPKPHEILVKVAAAGVNRPEVLQRIGKSIPLFSRTPAGRSAHEPNGELAISRSRVVCP